MRIMCLVCIGYKTTFTLVLTEDSCYKFSTCCPCPRHTGGAGQAEMSKSTQQHSNVSLVVPPNPSLRWILEPTKYKQAAGIAMAMIPNKIIPKFEVPSARYILIEIAAFS